MPVLYHPLEFYAMKKYMLTSELAKRVGVHPNTVRRYVDRGLLPAVQRTPAGYRRFTQRHLDCLRLAHEVYFGPHPGRTIRQSAARILPSLVDGDPARALELARRHLAFVQSEQAHADQAATLLEHWACGAIAEPPIRPLRIGQAARFLGVTIDVLRNWDRNGLIDVPRDPLNRYRRYGAEEISRLRVIRMLSRAGYSISAILRMLIQLEQDQATDLRHALDTPRPDEDVYVASDRWLSTLADQEERARAIVALVEEIVQSQSAKPN